VLRDTPGGPVLGYAIVGLVDAAALHPGPRAVARVVRAAVPAVLGPGRRDAARFLRGRVADAWTLRHPPAAVRGLPHAHLNAAPDRSGLPGRALSGFVDAVCAAAGHDAWYGEINARVGRRAAAITRWWGAEIVHRAPNHTLTRLVGEPVERLTVVRPVPAGDVARVA
jgi:hypothetical protein